MSDAHDEYNGGHELEAMNAGALLRIIVILSLVVGFAVFAVTEFFYKQRRDLEYGVNGSKPGYYLQKYWDDMDAQKEGLGDKAKAVAENPAQLRAEAPPAGWIHPDDLKAGGAG